MKNVLFATTAAGALLVGGIASAQGIALFGDARLGLGYNIDNDGQLLHDSSGNAPDDFRAISRVRFGVNMTGETDSGITFGATIRADNAVGGKGGVNNNGQTDGSVFVSGSWGTLTMGDTNAADEQWVGDVPGDFSLTGLGNPDETLFISNGGGFGSDSNGFASNALARPTIRYDFDIAGFGISLSSNRDLTDVGVGAGYSADFGGGSWSIGAGYYDFSSFDVTNTANVPVPIVDLNGNPVIDPATGNPAVTIVAGVPVTVTAPAGHQWSVGLKGTYDQFAFGTTYVNADGDGPSSFESLLIGGSFGWDAFTVGAYYGNYLSANGPVLGNRDGDQTYGLTAQYDLGGGAMVMTGVRQTYDYQTANGNGAVVGDFGISMAF